MRIAAVMAISAMAALGAGCSRKPAANVRVDPALAMLVPQDTVAIAGMKVEALRETPLFKKYAGQRRWPMLGEFVKRTGIDPRKDLWEVLIVSNGKETAMLARGKFTETGGLEPKIDIPGAGRYPYKGYTIIGSEDGGVTFTNSTTAVVGRLPAIRAILDQRDSSKGIPPALAALVQTVPASSQAWGATMGGAQFLAGVPLGGNLGNLNRLFASVGSAVGSWDLRSGMDFSGHVTCATDKDAKQMHDAARAMIGLGRLNTPDNERDLLQVFDAIKVSQDGPKVNIAASVSEEMVEKFLARLPE